MGKFVHDPTLPPTLTSVVAWPSEKLDSWLRKQQQTLRVSGFGTPHLNLRAPFQTSLSDEELVRALRQAIGDQPAFRVQIKGWKRVTGIIFLECELSPELAALHTRLLAVGPSSRTPYDGAEYRPHLTLALGILPWAADYLWEQVQQLTPPVGEFEVTALSLTREKDGEVQEWHTLPLPSEEEPQGATQGSGNILDSLATTRGMAHKK